MLRIALYQPDIPQNTGTILRLAACLGLAVDIIQPAGFDVSERAFRRAAMDYLPYVDISRHLDWAAFLNQQHADHRRIVLLTTQSDRNYTDFSFSASDTLLLGRESAGVPEDVHDAAAKRITIPMKSELRSLNVAIACAVVTGEAMRQLGP